MDKQLYEELFGIEGDLDVGFEDDLSQPVCDSASGGCGISSSTPGTFDVCESDDDVVFLEERTAVESSEPLNPVKALQLLAEEYSVPVSYNICEIDTGDMNSPLFYQCDLSAGSYKVTATSPERQLVKILAAQKCLHQMKEDHPDNEMPVWKTFSQIDVTLDPVFLLAQFCRGFQQCAPCYSYSRKTTESGEVEYLYKCYWNEAYTEGHGKNKAIAYRRAAFEMLDYIITQGMNEKKSSIVINHISVDPNIAKQLRDGQITQDELPVEPQPFEVKSHKGRDPNGPVVKVRYGFSPDATNEGECWRYLSEFHATFRAEGETELEAMKKCLATATHQARLFGDFIDNATCRKVKPSEQ